MKQEFVAFLASRNGLMAGTAFFVIVAVFAFVACMRMLRPRRSPDDRGRPARRRDRGRGRTSGKPDQAAADVVRPAIASALITGCLILPLVFTIALEDVFALPKTVALRLLAVLVGALLAVAVWRGARPSRFGILDLALVAFVGLSIAATVLSVDRSLSLGGERYQYQGLLSILAYAVLFIAARFSLAEDSHVRVLAAAMLASATIVAVYAIAQWVGLDPIWSELFKGRVFSTVGQANALASILAMAIAMALALVVGSGRRERAALVAAVVVVGAAFLVTFSRGGYVALAIAIGASGLVLLPGASLAAVRPYLPRIGIASAIAGLILLAAISVWQPAGELVGEIASRAISVADPTESSNRSHADLWAVGLKIAADHPLVGTGPDTYVIVFPEYRDLVLPADRAALMARFRPESPHQVYIAVASGQGLPALAAYLTIIGGCLVLAARAARTSMPATTRFALAALVGAVVVHLVTDSFMTAEPASTAVFWIVLGSLAGLAARVLPSDEDQRKPEPKGANASREAGQRKRPRSDSGASRC